MQSLFLGQLYFWRSYFFAFLQSNYFDTAVTFRSGYFFRAATFFEELLLCSSYYFQKATFLERNFYRVVSSCEQVVLQNSYFVATDTFLTKELVQKKNIYRRATFLKQVLLHSNNFFRTDSFFKKVPFQKKYFFKTATFWKQLIFQKINIPHYLLLLKSHSFKVGKTYHSMTDTFSEELLCKTDFFRRGTISQVHFLSTAHSLFISYQLSELDASSVQ